MLSTATPKTNNLLGRFPKLSHPFEVTATLYLPVFKSWVRTRVSSALSQRWGATRWCTSTRV